MSWHRIKTLAEFSSVEIVVLRLQLFEVILSNLKLCPNNY
jgi:hypothetical protein